MKCSIFTRAFALVLASFAGSAMGAADLGLTKTAAPNPVRVGRDLTYRLAVTNRGPHAATNVVVTDVLPASLNFISCQTSQGLYTNEAGTIYAYLGHLPAGATAAVTIVAVPTQEGVITNHASAVADNADGVRASAESIVQAANRSPVISLNSVYVVPLGASTTFVVTATDPDHDPLITLTNTMRPSGAAFDGTNFSWTATRGFWNTTNEIEFVADDHQGEPNSIVTNRSVIIVPYDADGDDMADGWEWDCFGTVVRNGTGDYDGDGQNDYAEYVAGTQPTNTTSALRVLGVATPAGTSNHHVNVTTEPGRRYVIYWRDSLTAGAWQPFASTNAGVWIETAPNSTNHVFVDDEGPNTTGSSPASGRRFYKVKVSRP